MYAPRNSPHRTAASDAPRKDAQPLAQPSQTLVAGTGLTHSIASIPLVPDAPVIQRFYVESSEPPGHTWIPDAQWDPQVYEVSPKVTKWRLYTLYRRKSVTPAKAPRTSSSAKQTANLRGTITDLERDLETFDAAKAEATLKAAIAKALLGAADVAARVDEFRAMIDGLPSSYIPDHVVNAAHKALNAYDRQVGLPGLAYLAPSKSADDAHVINRGISEAVLIEGEYYVPIYTAVTNSNIESSKHEYKDVGQDEKGRIQIQTGGQSKESTYWVSVGRPLRQVKWIDKYNVQHPDLAPLIRSFLVPIAIADAMSGETITEAGSSGSGKDLNVDKHYERNQYGIVNPESLEQLRQYALPGSLRTYYQVEPKQIPPKSWGDVRPADELRERLGIPTKTIPNFAIFVDPVARDFTAQGAFAGQADTLSRIFAYHTGNANFLPVGPGGAEVLPPQGQRDRVVRDFFLAHRPSDLQPKQPQNPKAALDPQEERSQIDAFVKSYVAPWATQARVSKAIADDYEDLAGPERGTLPTQAHGVTYRAANKPQRGQRRPEAIALSLETRRLLGARFAFLRGLAATVAAIAAAFKTRKLTPAALRILGPLGDQITAINADYGFRAGHAAVAEKQLPIYRALIVDYVQRLAVKEFENDVNVATVVSALGEALWATPPDFGGSSATHVPLPPKSARKSKQSGAAVVIVPVPVVGADGNALHRNQTAGDGNCFFHALYEALNEARSSAAAQNALRHRTVSALEANAALANSHFGVGGVRTAAFRHFSAAILRAGNWVGDQTPAIVADALRYRIVIHNPDGSVYFDAAPNVALVGAAAQTVHIEYTGDHYNSYTSAVL